MLLTPASRLQITTQRCSATGVEARALLEASSRLSHLQVGDLSWHRDGLRLGQLCGNRFTVVLRDPAKAAAVPMVSTLSLAQLQARVSLVQRHGFINYFGEQRVGRVGTAPNQPDQGCGPWLSVRVCLAVVTSLW